MGAWKLWLILEKTDTVFFCLAIELFQFDFILLYFVYCLVGCLFVCLVVRSFVRSLVGLFVCWLVCLFVCLVGLSVWFVWCGCLRQPRCDMQFEPKPQEASYCGGDMPNTTQTGSDVCVWQSRSCKGP